MRSLVRVQYGPLQNGPPVGRPVLSLLVGAFARRTLLTSLRSAADSIRRCAWARHGLRGDRAIVQRQVHTGAVEHAAGLHRRADSSVTRKRRRPRNRPTGQTISLPSSSGETPRSACPFSSSLLRENLIDVRNPLTGATVKCLPANRKALEASWRDEATSRSRRWARSLLASRTSLQLARGRSEPAPCHRARWSTNRTWLPARSRQLVRRTVR